MEVGRKRMWLEYNINNSIDSPKIKVWMWEDEFNKLNAPMTEEEWLTRYDRLYDTDRIKGEDTTPIQ